MLKTLKVSLFAFFFSPLNPFVPPHLFSLPPETQINPAEEVQTQKPRVPAHGSTLAGAQPFINQHDDATFFKFF